ncbi:MAG TPA: hypothetical protein DEH02_02260 [Bacteroidales bacterium]|nr:hypothetical protein [Bacteroidales bacterium]
MHVKQIIILLTIVLSSKAYSQTWVTIPDTNFINCLNINIPLAMNGNQMDISSPWVTTLTDTLYLPNANISDLTGIQYFTSLIRLNVNLNELTWLPPLPNSIKTLECGMNQLNSLPALPDSLRYLYCILNNLTVLPPLPSTLEQLWCEQNNLTSLPELPDSLWYLRCFYNNITELPEFPNKTQYVDCSYNQITNIVSLNPGLKVLLCHHNQLTSLPPLPQLERLTCYNNNISCFPVFPSSIQPKGWNSHNHYWAYYIVINNNPFDCLPNYLLDAMDTTTLSYPLCAEGNTHGCPVVTSVEEKWENNQHLFELTMVQNKAVIQASAAANLILYNTMGSVQLSSTINKGKQEIDVSNLTSGMYIVTIISGAKVYYEKIVIEH